MNVTLDTLYTVQTKIDDAEPDKQHYIDDGLDISYYFEEVSRWSTDKETIDKAVADAEDKASVEDLILRVAPHLAHNS
ncbi:MAG: hypothetical protein KUG81_02780 [Gammaproteobacteria bacterium]|nr:hypothetical protein [Gammaproteobacteria bacterium]